MDNDGTMKPQYVTGDNGIEHDHKQTMALHKICGTSQSHQFTMGSTFQCALAHRQTLDRRC
eukprot:4590417-Amphidinium_carterae.1